MKDELTEELGLLNKALETMLNRVPGMWNYDDKALTIVEIQIDAMSTYQKCLELRLSELK